MKILDTYPNNAAGHVCFICNNARRSLDNGEFEKIINTKREVWPGRGLVMICETCVLEAAGKLGSFDKKTSAAMGATIDTLQIEIAEAKTRIKELEALNDAFHLVSATDKPANS